MGKKYKQSAANNTIKIIISFLLIGFLYVLITNFLISKSDNQQYKYIVLFKDIGFLLFTLLFLFITRYKKQDDTKKDAPLNNHLDNLTESDISYKYLYKSMTQGVIFQNRAGVIIEANDAALQILGLTLNQVCGKIAYDPELKAIHEDGSDFPGKEHHRIFALQTGKVLNKVIMGIII